MHQINLFAPTFSAYCFRCSGGKDSARSVDTKNHIYSQQIVYKEKVSVLKDHILNHLSIFAKAAVWSEWN